MVRPDRIRPWSYSPPLVVTGLRLDGTEQPGAAEKHRIEIHPGTRGFRVDFAALDFTAPLRARYRYRLRGFDSRWTLTDASQASVTYTRLSPGQYALEVQGTNRAGVWSPHLLEVAVTVLPAFYQTAWFRTAVALALAALARGAWRLRVRRIEARSRELESLVALRTAELAEKNVQLEAAYAKIEEASLTDPLTGLRNRRYLEQALGADIEIASRRHESGLPSPESSFVFILADLDHFKSVNDTYGHEAGDAVLLQAASLLRSVFRASDHIVRWGGEEFLVVARFVEPNEAPAFAEKLRAAIAAHPFLLPDGSVIRRTASIGAAAFPFLPSRPRSVSWQATVAICDVALYGAKRNGRNAWLLLTPSEADAGEDVAAMFRESPLTAVTSDRIRVVTSIARELKWSQA
jgi:diguanylate cyclase (GGDEF)-like protein